MRSRPQSNLDTTSDPATAQVFVALIITFAIVGFITGLVAFVLELRREWIDRANVQVSYEIYPQAGPGKTRLLVILVENPGRQPTTIRAVGFGWVEPGFRHGSRISLTSVEGTTRRLEPGGFVEYPYEAFDQLTDLQRPIRAWAEYTGNKVAWSEAKYRAHAFLSAQGPEQVAKFGDLSDGTTPAPPAEPVERWWKLWTPRHTRRVTQPRS